MFDPAVILLPIIITAAVFFLLFVLGSYFAYRKVFFSDRRKTCDPRSGIDRRGYKPYADRMRVYVEDIISLPCEKFEIVSRDGLKLSARYYHVADGAPVKIFCHGYRSTPLRDFAISSLEYREGRYNMLFIDHRAHGDSEGKTITFGIKERLDLIDWVNFIIGRFGSDVKIILYGISMGGATVLMAAGEPLPESVKAIISDCPYSSPIDIILKVGKEGGMPSFILKPLARFGARIFGRFSLTQASPKEAVKRSSVPILLIHGESDSFVPAYMSDEIYAMNPSITLEKFDGADHAVCCLYDTEAYFELVNAFINRALSEDEYED